MTRKHFEAIADAICETYSEDARRTAGVAPGPWAWMRTRAAKRMGDALYAGNPRFDRGRFERACGLDR